MYVCVSVGTCVWMCMHIDAHTSGDPRLTGLNLDYIHFPLINCGRLS